MFLFKSKTQSDENVAEQEVKDQATQTKAVESAEPSFAFFQAPSFTPEEVAIMVNLISGATRRGALTIDEINVITPLYQKLCRVVKNEQSWFITEEFEVEDEENAQTSPDVSEDDGDADSVKSAGPRTGRGGKKKNKKNRKRR